MKGGGEGNQKQYHKMGDGQLESGLETMTNIDFFSGLCDRMQATV